VAQTKEQQNIIDTAVQLYKAKGQQLLKVKAIAGAGKTYTLVELTKAITPKRGMYLAYNKAIQLEAVQKFKGTTVECKTMHGLAYGEVVRQYGINVKPFTPRDITEKLTYENKIELVAMLESFFLSGHLDIREYLESKEVSQAAIDLLLSYYEKMLHGQIGGGHSFYLKLYHILLANGTIPIPDLDLLLVDEFGDITALTIEIFKLIDADLKVAVGDSGQNIYSFTHTIDGFKHLKGKGTTKKLTQSFRVSSKIAQRIESFAHSTFDKDMEFKGRKVTTIPDCTSHAYIARNNTELINKMISLNQYSIPFNITKSPSNIFGFILAVATLQPSKPVFDPRYKWLETIAMAYKQSHSSRPRSITMLEYLKLIHDEDPMLMRAVAIVEKVGSNALFNIYKIAKEYDDSKETYEVTLTTAHSSKGLEFHTVTIADDLNNSVKKSKQELSLHPLEKKKEKLLEEFRLYYVAISRCMYQLNNAKYC